jgi:xylan 1,4-beta-xylosidase
MRIQAVVAFAAIALAAQATTQSTPVTIAVDTAVVRGPLTPIWAWFGNDEPNYAYMRDGQKLLTELATASPVPVHFRTHNLLTSGDGTAALKWGSTNVYTEDAAGAPVYDWATLDRIIDTYRARKIVRSFSSASCPEALSSHPQPYRPFLEAGRQLQRHLHGLVLSAGRLRRSGAS